MISDQIAEIETIDVDPPGLPGLGKCESCTAEVQAGDRVIFTGEHYNLRAVMVLNDGKRLVLARRVPKFRHAGCCY